MYHRLQQIKHTSALYKQQSDLQLVSQQADIQSLTAESTTTKLHLHTAHDTITQLTADNAKLETELDYVQNNLVQLNQLISHTQQRMGDAFKALSAEALTTNNQTFLEIAQGIFEGYQQHAHSEWSQRQQLMNNALNPFKDLLVSFDQRVQDLEKQRLGAYASLTEQVKGLLNSQIRLESETASLARALRAPNVRGKWGELQLKRTVELAGMTAYVDFDEQVTFQTPEDSRQRPDMVINLPNGAHIIVDAKAPLSAYLEALEAKDETAIKAKLQSYARLVRDHISKLSSKAYWRGLTNTPEFVILFLPGEVFFSVALEQDATLIELAAKSNVILASPGNLIALLKVIAHGWQQAAFTKDANLVIQLGKELYERMLGLGDHLGDLRKSLSKSVETYNKTIASIENRILPAARKLKELNPTSTDPILPTLEIIESIPIPSHILKGFGTDTL